jgi:hypothetical protein
MSNSLQRRLLLCNDTLNMSTTIGELMVAVFSITYTMPPSHKRTVGCNPGTSETLAGYKEFEGAALTCTL